MSRFFSTAIVLAAATVACDQNMSEHPLPDARAEEISRLAERLSSAPSLSTPAGSTISGSIELDPRLLRLTAPTDVVYVIARDPAVDGPPLAVQRLTGNVYPMRFVVDLAAAMLPGSPDGAVVQLVVKVDKDGDVGTSSPTDLLGFTGRSVAPGDAGVAVTVEATLAEVAQVANEARGAEPSGGTDTTTPDPAGETPRLAGVVTLTPALKDRTSEDDVLFVIARDPEGAGPPVAVTRLTGNRYPLRFSLYDRDRMLGGNWPEALLVEVRLDRDGDPLTRGAQDLTATTPQPVPTGTSDVRLELGA